MQYVLQINTLMRGSHGKKGKMIQFHAKKRFIIVCISSLILQISGTILPFSSERIRNTLSIVNRNWEPQHTLPSRIDSVQPLFERIDVKQIERELEKLYGAVK